MRREERESGSNEEDTDNLLQNITEEWDEASASHDDQSKQKLKKTEAEKGNAEDVQQQAMETLAETRKRKRKDDNSGSKRNNGSETMVYLKNRAEQESYFKQQELELRKQELALQRERQGQQQQQQNLFQQQMMQQQQLMLATFKKNC